MEYDVISDLLLTKQILGITDIQLSKELNVSRSTLNRWINGESQMSNKNIESVYSFIFKKNIDINKIKSQLFIEDFTTSNKIVLFHGSKNGLDGKIDLAKSKELNDFGRGFYCGQTFEQAAMFSSNFPNSSIYIFTFDSTNLKMCKFDVNTEWMLAIAYFRGKLDDYKNNKIIKKIINKVNNSDYIIAPIADNKMYSIIGNFIDGEITDEQCKHCLSATDLGFQYIFINERSINNLETLAKCYITNQEKLQYLKNREESIKLGNNKVKAARIKYANKGKYIDQILSK